MEPDDLDPIENSLVVAQELNGDEEAKVYKLSEQTGLPKDVVRAAPSYAVQKADWDGLQNFYGRRLENLNSTLRKRMEEPSILSMSADSLRELDGLRKYNRYLAEDNQQAWTDTVLNSTENAAVNYLQTLSAVPEGVALAGAKVLGGNSLYWDPLTAKLQDFKNSQRVYTDEERQTLAQRLTGSTLESLLNPINLLPGLAGYTAAKAGIGAVKATYAMATTASMIEAYQTGTQQMIERQQAGEKNWVTAADMGNTLVSAALTFAGTAIGGFETRLFVGAEAGALRRGLANESVRSIIGGSIEGGGQAISQAAFSGQDISLADVAEGAAGEILPDILFGAIGGGRSLYNRIRGVAEDSVTAQTAINTAARISASHAAVHGSGFGQRAPDSVIQSVVGSQVNGTVYVTREDYDTFMAANPNSTLPFVAVEDGYSLSEAAIIAAKDKGNIEDFIRSDMSAPTAPEALEIHKSLPDVMKKLNEELTAPQLAEGIPDDTKEVAEQIAQQVADAGSPASAEAGTVAANMYRDIAEKINAATGSTLTPGDIHAKVGLTVAAVPQASAKEAPLAAEPVAVTPEQQTAAQVVETLKGLDPKKRRQAVVDDLRSRLKIGAKRATALADEALSAKSLPLQQVTNFVQGSYDPRKMMLTLMQKGNVATVFHELGHHYLNMLQKLAKDPVIGPTIVKDLEVVKKWWTDNADDIAAAAKERGQTVTADEIRNGIKDFENLEDTSVVWASCHEYFSYGFEQYMGEGKAPVKEMEPLFARLRRWFLDAYAAFGETRKVNLSPEIRAYFDQMALGSRVIEEGLGNRVTNNLTAEDVGLPQKTFDRILKKVQGFIDDMKDSVISSVVEAKKREQQSDRNKYLLDASLEMAKNPETAELAAIGIQPGDKLTTLTAAQSAYAQQTGKSDALFIAHVEQMESREDLADRMMSADGVKMTDEDVRNKAADTLNGQEHFMVAAYEAAMFKAAQTVSVSNKNAVELRNKRIEKLKQKVASLRKHHEARLKALRDGMKDRLADAKDAYKEKLDKKIESLTKKHDKEVADLEQEIEDMKQTADTEKADAVALVRSIQDAEAAQRKNAKMLARVHVATLTYTQLKNDRSKSKAKQFSARAYMAIAKRDLQQAGMLKSQEVLSLAIAEEVASVRSRMESRAKDMVRYAKDAALQDYLSYGRAIVILPNGAVQQFSSTNEARTFAAANDGYATTDDSLKVYVQGTAEALGLRDPKQISPNDYLGAAQSWGLNPVTSQYADMTAGEFDAVVANVRGTIGTAKALAKSRNDITNDINSLSQQAAMANPSWIKEDTKMNTLATGVKKYSLGMFKKLYVRLEQLGDAWVDKVKIPMRMAEEVFSRRREEILLPISDLAQKFHTAAVDEKRDMGNGVFLSRNEVMSLAGIMGREDGVKVVMSHMQALNPNFNAVDLQAALDTLTAEEIQYIQAMWDANENVRVLADGEMRLIGKDTPEWSKKNAFTVRGQVLSGGYFAVIRNQATNMATANKPFTSLHVALGNWTKQFNAVGVKSEKELVLDVNAQIGHANRVLREISFTKYASDMDAIFNDVNIQRTLDSNHGPAFRDDLVKQIQFAMVGPDIQAWEWRVLASARANVTTSVQALRVISGVQQLAGLAVAKSHPDVSMSNLGAAFYRLLTDFGGEVDRVHALSKHMQKRSFGDLSHDITDAKVGIRDTWQARLRGKLMVFTTTVQHYTVDIPVWMAAFDKYTDQGMDQATAALKASEVVDQTQGGADYSEMSPAQQHDLGRALMVLQSFKVVALSRMLSSYQKIQGLDDYAGMMRFASSVTTAALIPAIMTFGIKYALRNLAAGEDDEQPWFKNMLAAAGLETIGLNPFIGAGISAVQGLPAPEAIPGISSAGKGLYALVRGSDDEDKDTAARVRGGIAFSALFVPLPAVEMGNIIGAMNEANDVDMQATIMHAIMGTPMKSAFKP